MLQGLMVVAGLLAAVILGVYCFWANPASLPNYLMTVVNVVLAIFACGSEPNRKVNRAFTLFALSVAGWGADVTFLFIAPTEEIASFGVRFARLGLLYLFPAMIYFVTVFYRREGHRKAIVLALSVSTLFSILSVGGFLDAGIAWKQKTWVPIPNAWYHLYSLFVFLTPVYCCTIAIPAWKNEAIPRLRLQYRQFLVALIITSVLGWTNQIATYLGAFAPRVIAGLGAVTFYGAIGGVVFFALISFAIVRDRFLDISFVIRRTLLYSTLTAGTAGVYGLLLALFNGMLQGAESSYAASVGTILLVAFAFLPLREKLQRSIDRLFHREAYDERLVMERMTERVASVVGNRQISRTVLDVLVPVMKIQRAQISLGTRLFERTFNEEWRESDASRFDVPAGPVDRTEIGDATPASIQNHLKAHGLELAFPIRSRDFDAGVLFIGSKVSELPYRPEEVRLLRTAAQQIAIAAENSRLYEEVLAMKTYNDNILKSMDDGLITFSPSGDIISTNPAAKRILGGFSNGSIDTSFPGIPELAKICRQTLQSGAGIQHIEVQSGIDGERTLLATATPLHDQEGSTSGGILLFADITDKKDMERRLERDRRLAMIGQLASQIAHEIRNPIGSMKILVDSLPERRSDPEFEKMFMSTVPSEIDRLNRLVGELLDFARPLRLIRVPIDLAEILNLSLRLSEPGLHGVTVERHLESKPTVHADGEKLKQVFLNLIRNASQSMAQSTVRRLSIRIADAPLRVEVKDSGVGMDERQLGRIFTPFYSTKTDGTGLGLAIVHRIIEEHGWSITVASRPGEGSTFTIFIKN